MTSRRGVFKRPADVPQQARALHSMLSKSELMEAAWHLASLCNDTGCDDDEATFRRLVEELNILRARRGARQLVVGPKKPRINPEYEAYRASVERVMHELRGVGYTEDQAVAWMKIPQRLLGGAPPSRLLLQGDGDGVLAVIEQLKDGAFV